VPIDRLGICDIVRNDLDTKLMTSTTAMYWGQGRRSAENCVSHPDNRRL